MEQPQAPGPRAADVAEATARLALDAATDATIAAARAVHVQSGDALAVELRAAVREVGIAEPSADAVADAVRASMSRLLGMAYRSSDPLGDAERLGTMIERYGAWLTLLGRPRR